MSIRIDYDSIADVYDESRRDHPPDSRLEAFVGEGATTALRVLDVGCGTGKQLAANRARFGGITLVGVDRSAGMLRIAQTRDASVAWIRGDAQALPLSSSAFDYVTNQFSYPHIADKTRFVNEVFRVLRPGGRFVLTNIDPWAMDGWILYRYFPDGRVLDERDFLPRASLVRLLADAGFIGVTSTATDLSRDEDLAAYLPYVSQRHTASQLLAISDAAYEAGLRRVRDELASTAGHAIVWSQFVIITVVADKPGPHPV